eukprot:15502269-Heterocapsa_arctica.AAC.1
MRTTGHCALREPGEQLEPCGAQAVGGDSPRMPEGPSAAALGPTCHWCGDGGSTPQIWAPCPPRRHRPQTC